LREFSINSFSSPVKTLAAWFCSSSDFDFISLVISSGEAVVFSFLTLFDTSSKTSGSKASSSSLATCEIVLPPAFFSNSIFCFSVSCLSKLAKRLAIVLNNSASLAPTAMALSKSFKGADGFLSRG